MAHQRTLLQELDRKLDELKDDGLYKEERLICSPQQASVVLGESEYLNLCANNYLGLANNQELVTVAQEALKTYGYGMSSVRFICGTQDIHRKLERQLSRFLGTEDTILYSSCFDANTGLFETVLGHEDAVISDSLNHASIIDGIRLCKAKRFRYKNKDLTDLETQLKSASSCRHRMIATDGVFSMDGSFAKLDAIAKLAEDYGAYLMVDDSHAVGFVGEQGRGTPSLFGVADKVDLLTGTLGKALGGASGGYVSGRRELIQWLRQRSRPYLFSNSLAPVIVATSLKALDMIESDDGLRCRLDENSRYFRAKMAAQGFDLLPGTHPIVPIMVYDAKKSQDFASALLREGIYVVSFSYPVVGEGKARIRTQMSAALSTAQLEFAVETFTKIGRELSII